MHRCRLSNGSLRSIFYTLKQLRKAVDLMKPEEVKTHISTMRAHVLFKAITDTI
jgi:hypothetical protein